MSYFLAQRLASTFRSILSSKLSLQRREWFQMSSLAALPQQLPANMPSIDNNNSNRASLALRASEDDPSIRQKYRPFILNNDSAATTTDDDWINNLELTTALDMAEKNLQATNQRLRVLVLYGSLRKRSYSRLVAFEASRILFRLGCDVRVFDPEGLPVKNDSEHGHPKVQELRELSRWSDGHVWVSPEQHGNLVSFLSLL